VALFPQAPPDSAWEGKTAERVLRQIDATIEEFRLDPDRVYLTGASMGGEGVYYLAMRHPSRFAGLVVSCGSPFTPAWRLEDLGRPPADRSSAAFSEVARATQGLPLRAFHGSDDALVDVEEARAMMRAFEASGADAILKEYPGFGHDACGWAFHEETLWPWLFAQRRSRE
jgi:predicted peptidase